MQYTIKNIGEVIGANSILPQPMHVIEHVLTDSRSLVFPKSTLFFAIRSERRNGAEFINELIERGVSNFVAEQKLNTSDLPEVNFLLVDDVLQALQKLADFHRRQYSLPVLGITGSNGKTIVKEWLFQLMNGDKKIVRSPKSFNSQLGVPLSVIQMSEPHELAIFEAGISQPGEMEKLQRIIQPTIGILTNIGEAHAAGFTSLEQKLEEKAKLFSQASLIICNEVYAQTLKELHPASKLFTWGYNQCDLQIISTNTNAAQTSISALYGQTNISINIPFTDNASIENAVTCWSFLLSQGMANEVIAKRMLALTPVEMRLQLKKAMNNCSIINDSYSNDLSSLQIALDFLHQQSGIQHTAVILSDLGETEVSEEIYQRVAEALSQHRIQKFVGIGPALMTFQSLFTKQIPATFFYNSVDDFLHHFPLIRFNDELILLKGARSFEFERIDQLFEKQVHQTVMEVNLTAMIQNLKAYQQYLRPSTKIMAMVKAFSYGSGSAEIASVLQHHKVDYLAVAYADEGVELRKSGIHMPIMVMNPEEATFHYLVQYNLEPELFSFEIISAFTMYLRREGILQFPLHIKLDTGMHRLGFETNDLPDLISFLIDNPALVVKSTFSHLVASEDPQHDEFTKQQGLVFESACQKIEKALGYSFTKHIANTAAIFRHPNLEFDMVRLGIGLYGIDTVAEKALPLKPVATLRTTVAQVRKLKMGESVGYGRRGIMEKDGTIATLRIGYADGFSRRLGNGIGHVWIRGRRAPVIGSVCMDMIMVDVSAVDGVAPGDIVEIFGSHISVQQVAEWCQTIPYEIMTGISQRVKRVYFQE